MTVKDANCKRLKFLRANDSLKVRERHKWKGSSDSISCTKTEQNAKMPDVKVHSDKFKLSV